MEVANVHMPILKWSKIKIDTDKDMDGKSLANLNEIIANKVNGFNIKYDVDLDGNIEFSKVRIDTDKDMNGKSLTNIQNIYINGDLGSLSQRAVNGWFSGNLGLGVIKEIGESLTVDVIYEEDYYLKASDLAIRSYTLGGEQYVTDWDIGTLSTETENGAITKVKFQVSAYIEAGNKYYYKLYENGVEKLSFYVTSSSYQTYSGEYICLKSSASFKGRLYNSYSVDIPAHVKNRYLYFKKCYLGIKAGL